MKYKIYAIVNTPENKVYIGSGDDIPFHNLSEGTHHNEELQKDYKFGADLKYEVLEEVSIKHLKLQENYWKYYYQFDGWYLYDKPKRITIYNEEWVESILLEAKERGVRISIYESNL